MIKIGLCGIGLETYWPQFDGLLNKLEKYHQYIHSQISDSDITVIDAGIIDNAAKVQNAAKLYSDEQVDALFISISTYALSQNVLPLANKIKVPLVILNLQPDKAIDYDALNKLEDRGQMTGEWLAYCQSCVAPELASVFNRAGISFTLISGYLKQEDVWQETADFLSALKVKKQLSNTKTGLLGHYYNGMLDVYSDLTQQSACFGNQYDIIEMGLLKQLRNQVSDELINKKIKEFEEKFNVAETCTRFELERAAKTAVALDQLVEKHNLNALAYYYEGEGDDDYLDIVTSWIPGLTLLTGRNIPAAGEYEIKNCQAMKILDIMGCGGSFSEFYAMDFNDEVILLGHDGPAHFSIAEGKVCLVPLPVYHGKPGKGLSIQMKVKNGLVTLLSVCQGADGKVFLLVAEGESVEGPTLQIGNTNSRYKFNIPIKEFINNWSVAGPSHHCAIGTGHKAAVIEQLAKLLNINCIQIC